MKKNYGFLFLALAFGMSFSIGALAQENSGSSQSTITSEGRSPDRFLRRVIFEGALANAGYQGDNTDRYSKPNGYSAGAVVDLLGSQNLVLETGVLYRQFGTNYNNGLGDNSFTANYISVPVTAKYYLSGQEVTSLYIKAGAMGSTLISDNTMYVTPTKQVGARSWETALLGGLGVKVNLSSATDLVLEGDYSRSIDSVLKDENIYRSDLSAALGFAVNL